MRKSSSYLLIGVTAGVVMGGWMTLLVLKNEPSSGASTTSTTSPAVSPPRRSIEKKQQISKKEIIEKAQREVKASIAQIEQEIALEHHSTTKEKTPSTSLALPILPKETITEQDTSRLDTGAVPNIILNTDEIVVKREVLLARSDLRLELYDSTLYQEQIHPELDSIIEESAQVVIQDKHLYKVEYWESPIHFKGYKMANNKIVLYGLEPDTNNKLVLFEDHLYFRHQAGVFKLDPSFESRPFNKVEDEFILQQLF